MAYIQKGSPFKNTDPNKKVVKKNLSGFNAETGGYQVGQEIETTEFIVPGNEAASINNVYNTPTVSNNKKISYKQAFDNMSAGDKLKKGYSNDDEGFQKFKGEAIEYNSLNKNYNEGLNPKIPEGGLKGDLYKVNVETKGVDLDMGQTNTTKDTRIDTLYTRDIGDAQSSYARRKNIRSGKLSSRVEKNQSIKEARVKAKKLNLKGDKKRKFIKDAKLDAKLKQLESNKNIAASENKNARNQSSQNIKVGGKVKGDARIVGRGDGAAIIKKSREEVAAANAGPTFKMGGYGSKNKNK